MNGRKFGGVVFDLDGTLVESAAAIRDVANMLMAELSLAPLDTAETRSYVGNGAPVFLERALRARDAFDTGTFSGLLPRFLKLYADAPGEANIPFPNVRETLAKLAADGFSLAICTNKPGAPTTAVVAALGWTDTFAAVVAGDTLSKRKPDPEMLLEAQRRLGGAPIVYVGDSEVDADTAANAGVPFVLYTEGYRKTPVADMTWTATISDFADLPDTIARLTDSTAAA